MNILPPHRPAELAATTAALLAHAGVNTPVALVGERGYFRDSMGQPGQNDRGIYDDALTLHTPSVHACFNANTDPSVSRPGIAVLQPGLWHYQLGIPHLSLPPQFRYPALVQAAAVTVHRDGGGEESGFFGINIHHGGYGSTSSLGCQTIYPGQWESFFALVKSELQRHNQVVVPYLLVERQG